MDNTAKTLVLAIVQLVRVLFASIDGMEFEGVILERHNFWRSLIANGRLSNQPDGANIEQLLWEHETQRLAQLYVNECNAKRAPLVLDSDYLDDIGFAFEADFGRYKFGVNRAYIEYDMDANLTDTQWLYALQNVTDAWFMQHEQYVYGDVVSDDTENYVNAVMGATRYIGCGVSECPIFACDPLENAGCCPLGVCVRYLFITCYYFPSAYPLQSTVPYTNGSACTQCTSDRRQRCDDGLCSGCPSPHFFACQDGVVCDKLPNNTSPCQNPALVSSCPASCDANCSALNGSDHALCHQQPVSVLATQTPATPNPIPKAPTNTPSETPITTLAPSPSVVTISPSQADSTEQPTILPTVDLTDFPSAHQSLPPTTSTAQPNMAPSFIQTGALTIHPTAMNPAVSTSTDSPSTSIPSVMPSSSATTTAEPSVFPTSLSLTNQPTHAPTITLTTYSPTHAPTFPTPMITFSGSPSSIMTTAPPSPSEMTSTTTALPTMMPSADNTYHCGINFLPFSDWSICNESCTGDRKKKHRLVYYYDCDTHTLTYLGTQMVAKACM